MANEKLPAILDEKALEGLTEEEKTELIAMYQESLEDNLAGEEVSFPRIEILHSAGLFQMPDDTKIENVIGIILEKCHALAYWKDPPVKGETSPPDCSSRDGLKPEEGVLDLQSADCKSCPNNQFGTARGDQGEKRRGKACRNQRRLFLYLEGHKVPFMLSVSPASLSNFKAYMVILTDVDIPKDNLYTVFTLEVIKGVNTYSIMKFSLGDRLAPIEYLRLKREMKAKFPEMQIVPMVAEEFFGETEQAEKDDDELPF